MTTVVLDPGHGGTTVVGGSSPNNATGPNGLLEKTVTLKVALAAELALRGSGVQVLLTRQDDRNVGIVARAAVARRVAAAAFVSIHFNAPGEGGSAQGTETWVGVGHTRISRALAGLVQEHVLAVTGHRDRGVKTGNVSGVIKPANQDPQTANCLVEISFLSGQAEEERRLQNQRYIDELGQALADAVLASLRQRELIGDVELVATLEPDDAASARRLGVIRDADRFALAEAPAVERYAHRELPVSGALEMTSIEVPFIVPDVSGERPFADLGGDAPIDDPAEMLDGWRRLRTGGPEVEAAVGRFVTVPAALVQLLSDRRRCVARLTASGTDFRGIAQPSPWIGTGFLVDKNLLLTNHHVLNSVEVAQTATVEFDYEIAADDLLAGTIVRPRAPRVFRVDPRRLFVTSPVERGLDFTFVWIDDTAATTFGTIPMERSSFTVKPGEQAFLIHHPQGRPRRSPSTTPTF